jgi:hypothetical protein
VRRVGRRGGVHLLSVLNEPIGAIDVTSPLEISANAVNALSILLAGRNSVHTWWTGIIGCAL